MAPSMTQHHAHAYVMQPDGGQRIAALRIRLLATGALTGGALCALECVNPGPGGPPLHTHHAHDEWYFVLQGRYRFRIGACDQEGGPGTFAYVPHGVVHAFARVGSEEGRLLSASLPGGLEHFLERMAALQARSATQEEVVALHRDYQSEINGPALLQAEC